MSRFVVRGPVLVRVATIERKSRDPNGQYNQIVPNNAMQYFSPGGIRVLLFVSQMVVLHPKGVPFLSFICVDKNGKFVDSSRVMVSRLSLSKIGGKSLDRSNDSNVSKKMRLQIWMY